MATMSAYNPGTFCWVDLATSDADGAKSFYSGLFGWETIDVPVDEGVVYTMLKQNDQNVCALYLMDPDRMTQGIPPHWVSYVSVASADETAAKARQLEGTVFMEPFDVMDAGRMAVMADPGGAVFSVWQAGENFGAELVSEPNSLCWNELYTNDVDACSVFYTALFGWERETMETPSGDYFLWVNGERRNGGMMAIQEEWSEVPPNWGVYFAVVDCDATLERAKELGGTVVWGPMESPEVGKFANIRDPQGAHFSVIKLAVTD